MKKKKDINGGDYTSITEMIFEDCSKMSNRQIILQILLLTIGMIQLLLFNFTLLYLKNIFKNKIKEE